MKECIDDKPFRANACEACLTSLGGRFYDTKEIHLHEPCIFCCEVHKTQRFSIVFEDMREDKEPA